MAKNREPEKPMESETESGEEENEEASSEEGGSSETESEPEPEPEPEQTQSTNKPSTLPLAAVKKTPQPPSSSDEEESESESDSDGADPNARPIACKPVEDPHKSAGAVAKPRSRSGASGTVTPVKSASAKRPAEEKEPEAKDTKRSRKKPEPEIENSEKKGTEDSKKLQPFQRFWSEEDEIVILKGMIDYGKKKNNPDPVADLNAFHEFIKDNLHVQDVTRTQLQDKIRRLKKKYENNKSKEKQGKLTFTKPHEQKVYELSKHIWGINENEKAESTPKPNGSSSAKKTQSKGANAVEDGTYSIRKTIQSKRANAVENGDDEAAKKLEAMDVDVDINIPKIMSSSDLRLEEKILRIGAELFEGDKNVEGSEEWRKLRMEEMKLFLKKVELIGAQTRLVLDVLNSSEH